MPLQACTHALAGDFSVVGPVVPGVHALALIHDVSGTHAVEGVSAVVSPTLLELASLHPDAAAYL
jgi:hypothetical protein